MAKDSKTRNFHGRYFWKVLLVSIKAVIIVLWAGLAVSRALPCPCQVSPPRKPPVNHPNAVHESPLPPSDLISISIIPIREVAIESSTYMSVKRSYIDNRIGK